MEPEAPPTDAQFDEALVASAFRIAALDGWSMVTVPAAARDAGLPLDRARARFPGRAAILARFGRMADQEALAIPAGDASPRDHLFDLLMRRFDAHQRHRDGILALLRTLPAAPLRAAFLSASTLNSMGWMLEASGLATTGPVGALRAQALLGVWLYTTRAWARDDSPDMPGTMAALDRALNRVAQLEDWWQSRTTRPEPPIPDFPTDAELDLPPDPELPVVLPPPPPMDTGSAPV